jgi:hypothetical protein
MTEGMDHDRCSGLLGAHVRNQLDAPTSAAIEQHLSHCRQCGMERDALVALVSGGELRLQDHERSRLRRAVWAEVRPTPAPVVPIRRRRERVGQLLGAAALVAVLVTGLFYVTGTGGGDLSGQGAGVAEEGADQVEAGGEAGRKGAAREKGKLERNRSAATQFTQDRVARPRFARGERVIVPEELDEIVRSEPFRSFSTLEASEAPGRAELTGDLARQAPDDLSAQVESCATRVDDTSSATVLPVYGTAGTLNGRRVLVLGFVHSETAGGPLDRFMLWAWPRGDCSRVLEHREGPIPRP